MECTAQSSELQQCEENDNLLFNYRGPLNFIHGIQKNSMWNFNMASEGEKSRIVFNLNRFEDVSWGI